MDSSGKERVNIKHFKFYFLRKKIDYVKINPALDG